MELKTQPNFSSEEERLKILNIHDVLAKPSCFFIAEQNIYYNCLSCVYVYTHSFTEKKFS